MSWFWNPAGAASVESFGIAAGRQNLYANLDLHQAYAAFALPLLGGAVGVSFNTLTSGDMPRTTETFPFGRTGAGLQFQWNSTAVGLGYARRMTDRLSVGAQAKYVTEGITNATEKWVAFDIGTQFNTGIYGLMLGGALQQIGGASRVTGPVIQNTINDANVNAQVTRENFYTNAVDLPTSFRFSIGNDLYGSAESLLGGAGGPHHLNAEFSTNDAVDLAPQYALGAEYSFRERLFLRGGKKVYSDQRAGDAGGSKFGLSGGFGLRLPRNIRFDYSYTNSGDLSNIQIFSFEFGR